MLKVSIRSCPICENRHVEVLHYQHFILPQGHPLIAGYDVVSCRRCDFIFADVTLSQKDYDLFYSSFSKYEDKKTASGGGFTTWDLKRLEETTAYLKKIWPDKKTPIVDVGCSNGGLLYQLKKAGYEKLFGIDPSSICVQNTIALGIDADVGTLMCLPENNEPFDRVILSHVLEHVADLQGAIRAVCMQIRAGGQVYIELPDASRYADALFSPFQEFNTEHINHFTTITCANLMESFGFVNLEQGKRVIESSPGKPYPVIYGMWLKDSCSENKVELRRDSEVKSKIYDYIAKSEALMDNIKKRLADIYMCYPRIILWGTGQLLLKLLADKELKKSAILVFVDGNRVNQGNNLEGIPILAPEAIWQFHAPILITTLLHQKEITETIKQMGLPNEILTLI